jgi:hypothetical protein
VARRLEPAGSGGVGTSALRATRSFLGWTNRKHALDDAGRKAPDQAARSSVCNAPARACSLVFVFVLSAGVHAGPVQAAGDAPGGLSTQIQGVVDSALSSTAAQPLNYASATKAEDAANEAVALAEDVAADATSTATSISGQEWPSSAEAAAAEPLEPGARPSNGELSARARPGSARPPRARQTARPHEPASRTGTRLVAVTVVSSAWYGVSHSTTEKSETTSAAPRPHRAAVPERPRRHAPAPSGPDSSWSGQSGGQSTPVPLLLAALAGLLIIVGFNFLPRVLPKSAFRKPRLIVLPPWHPG